MSSIAIKILASLTTVVGLGGAIYGVYSYNNTTDTVSNYLLKNNFEIREKDWEKVLEAYKIEKESATEIQSGEINDKNVIKTWCETNLIKSINSTSDSLFKKASKWCVKFEIISDKFGDEKFEKTAEKLTSKYDSLKGKIKEFIDGITINSGSNGNGDKIKKWCDENKKRRFAEDDELYSGNIKTICLIAEE